jgi:signal transduction histidine kinase/ligand-binding sensor domain-containing protein
MSGFKPAQILGVALIITALLAAGGSAAAAPAEAGPHQQEGPLWPAVGYGAGTMRFDQLGVAEGLSDNTVLTVLQDRQGFLWFGTREGLNKYNGYDVTVYKADPNDPGALSDGYITAAIETEDGALWLGTVYGGLNRFDPDLDRFKHFLPDPDDPASLPHAQVRALLADSGGFLWVGTRAGLSRLDLDAGGGFQTFQHDPGDPRSLSHNDILALYEDPQGTLWVGTDQGLNRFDPDTGAFDRFIHAASLGYARIHSITGDGDTGLWLGTGGGLVHFNTITGTYRVYQHDPDQPDSLSHHQIHVVYRDSAGQLWLGLEEGGVNLVTEIGLGRIHVIRYSQADEDAHSLSHDSVRAIFEDDGGVMWFGTLGGGANKADPDTRAFGHYRHFPEDPHSLAGDRVTALAFDANRAALWVGTAEAGLDRMDLNSGEFTHYAHESQAPHALSDDYVTVLHLDGGGRLWAATRSGLLEYYDSQVDGFVTLPLDLADHGVDSVITDIHHDPANNLWVSFEGGELLKLLPSRAEMVWYYLQPEESRLLVDNTILTIYPGRDGVIWLGTENQGLVRFDPAAETFIRYTKRGDGLGPSHNSITTIYEDDLGLLWLGTSGGGLNRFNPETGGFDHVTTQDGLPSNRIFGILQDAFGALWLSTGNGLSRYHPITQVVRNFDARDGLQGNTFTIQAAAASGDGALFFGGVNGLNAFYPHRIEDNDHVPPVVITAVSLFNQTLLTDITHCAQSLTLSHDQNFLSFEFAALDFTAPGKNQYAYKLEGLNEDYVYVGNRRHADYPNLPSGSYVFRLIGSNNDGVWNTSGACLMIEIRPPFWSTWWFIALVGLVLAGSVVLGYRLRLRTIETQRQQLAVQVFKRTQEIERRRQIAAGLSEVVRLLNTSQPLEESLDFIVKQAIGLTAASKAAIFERQGDQVVVKACYPDEETHALSLSDPGSSSARCLLESIFLKRYLIYSRIDPKTMQSDTRWELVTGDYRTVICMPLIVSDSVYGGLVMYYGEERTFTPDEINLAHTLADQASLAIANERLKVNAQDLAVAAERNRLARDLHDAVTQTLFSSSLIAEVLPRIWEKEPEEGRRRLQELRQLARGALAEMRTLLLELRPSALADADPVELFKHLTDAFTGRTGIPVRFEIAAPDGCAMPLEVKNVFYRVAQEGLNNIFKHAQATQVWFKFSCDARRAMLIITDNGVGFDTEAGAAGRLGLGIMRERVESIGGDLKIVSQMGEGTTLHLVWIFEENTLK